MRRFAEIVPSIPWRRAGSPLSEKRSRQVGLPEKAKRLSKAMPHPVLATEYFDDDFVEFALYRGGKRVARHIPAEFEDIARSPGKPGAWAEQLGLSMETRKILEILFKETSPEVSLHLLECAL